MTGFPFDNKIEMRLRRATYIPFLTFLRKMVGHQPPLIDIRNKHTFKDNHRKGTYFKREGLS